MKARDLVNQLQKYDPDEEVIALEKLAEEICKLDEHESDDDENNNDYNNGNN